MAIITTHDHLARIVEDLNAGRAVTDRDDVHVLATAIDGGAVRFTTDVRIATNPSRIAIGVPNLPTAIAVRNRIANDHRLGRTNPALSLGADVVVRPHLTGPTTIGSGHRDLVDWVDALTVESSDDTESDEWVQAADLVPGDAVDLATVPILSIEPSAEFELASVESADRENDRVVGLFTDAGSAGVPADLWVRRTRHAHLAADLIGGTDPESAVEKVIERIRESEHDNALVAVNQGDLPGSAMADCQTADWILGSVEQMDDDILEDIIGLGIPGGICRAIITTYFTDTPEPDEDDGRVTISLSDRGVAKLAAAAGVTVEAFLATLTGTDTDPVPPVSPKAVPSGSRPRLWGTARKHAISAIATTVGVAANAAGRLLDRDPSAPSLRPDQGHLVDTIRDAYLTGDPHGLVVQQVLHARHGLSMAWSVGDHRGTVTTDDGDIVVAWGPDGIVVDLPTGRADARPSPDPAKVADRIARLINGGSS